MKNSVWIRNPQGKASSFQCEVSFVDVVTFLKWDFLNLRGNLGLILITYGINLEWFNLFCLPSRGRLLFEFGFQNLRSGCLNKGDIIINIRLLWPENWGGLILGISFGGRELDRES